MHKKNSPPYVPWFHGDFLRSTQAWNLLEQAGFWKLLCFQWDAGMVPDDLSRIAFIIGTDSTTMATIWPVISKKFVATPDGLINPRMEAHRENYIAYRASQSRNGKRGAEARWGGSSTVLPFTKHEGGSNE